MTVDWSSVFLNVTRVVLELEKSISGFVFSALVATVVFRALNPICVVLLVVLVCNELIWSSIVSIFSDNEISVTASPSPIVNVASVSRPVLVPVTVKFFTVRFSIVAVPSTTKSSSTFRSFTNSLNAISFTNDILLRYTQKRPLKNFPIFLVLFTHFLLCSRVSSFILFPMLRPLTSFPFINASLSTLACWVWSAL